MSYQWYPIVDYMPDNGAPSTVDLRAALTDASGPVAHRLSYPLDSRPFLDVNRKSNPIIYGMRPKLDILCDVITLADQAAVATLVSRLADRNWAVYLSLDGGFTSRQIVLTGYRGPDPLGGKTVAGARHTVSVETGSLLAELPSMSSGSTGGPDEKIENGAFDDWNANDAFSWVETVSGGNTIAKDAVNFVSPLYSALMTFNGVGGSDLRLTSSQFPLYPGRFYNFAIQARGSAGSLPFLAIRLVNATKLRSLATPLTPILWVAGVTNSFAIVTPGNLTWVPFSFQVQTSPSFDVSDLYYLEIFWNAVAVTSVSVDDVSLTGPVTPTGVARW